MSKRNSKSYDWFTEAMKELFARLEKVGEVGFSRITTPFEDRENHHEPGDEELDRN